MHTTDTTGKVKRLALIGEITIATALILLLAATGIVFAMAVMDQDFARTQLADGFQNLVRLSNGQTAGAMALGFAPNLIGAAMLFFAWRLFHGFRRDGVFTQKAGARLRMMGGC